MKKLKRDKNNIKVLFICKKRNDAYGVSFGLINSCRFICNALSDYGISAKVVSVTDNNCIDREVHQYKPTHVFIEALWVVPDKFKVLIPLYPHIQWYVRIHSKVPFLAHEGVAMEWLRQYAELGKTYHNLHIAANSLECVNDLEQAYGIHAIYSPNIYHPNHCDDLPPKYHKPDPKYIDIGCFGAIRPMKNQLIQALAAITFGNKIHKTIRFHINGNRVEQRGDSILKNLENAFANTNHELIKHPWMNHHEFIHLIRKMELGMQVSYSETFNIVAGDFVWNNIPVIGSSEVDWLADVYKADPNNIDNILTRLYIAYYGRQTELQRFNLHGLKKYNIESVRIWLELLKVL